MDETFIKRNEWKNKIEFHISIECIALASKTFFLDFWDVIIMS